MSKRLGSWDFRSRPTGLWRAVLRAPVHLFRWHLGLPLGDRFALIDHVGRRTGRVHQVVVEVVDHDQAAGEYVVCSGTGPGADWYRNLCASESPRIQVGSTGWVPRQRLPDQQEAAERFRRYEAAHPTAARRLLRSMGNGYDGTDAGRVAMMAEMPMVAFSDTPR